MKGRENDNKKNLFNHSDNQSLKSSITLRNDQAPNSNNNNQIPNFLQNLEEDRVNLQEVVNPLVRTLSQNQGRLQNNEIADLLFQEEQAQEHFLRINSSSIVDPNLENASQIAANPDRPLLYDVVNTTISLPAGESHTSGYVSNHNLRIQIQNLINDHQEVITQQNRFIRNNVEMATQGIRENVDRLQEVVMNIQNNQPNP
jgi:hypothetical protein